MLFTDLESADQAIEALNSAALAIAGELDLDRVLQQIVDTARVLAGARYAALGIPNQSGSLGQFIYSGLAAEDAKKIPFQPKGKGLLGVLFQEKKSIRTKNIHNDPRSVGFPENHPMMSSFLGVPIVGAGEILGNIYLTEKVLGDDFSETDQKLVEMLAAHASIAIQNANLYRQVERLAILEERTRIGMDLHDGVIQSIYAVGLTLESTRLVLHDETVDASELLELAIEGLNDAIRDIRNFILDLRPRRFSGDLSQGLASLVREFQANTMVPVEMIVTQQLADLPTSLARTIFLTTQEALANIARHAKADNVFLNLMRSGESVILIIQDNGKGFDPFDNSRQVGHGLANMEARADGLGGTFKIRSSPGSGTTISLRIPIG